MAKIISVSKAKARLLQLVREADTLGESFILVRDSEPIGALLPFDEYESLLETLDILETEPGILSKLKRAEREMVKGRFHTWKPSKARRKTSKREAKKFVA